MSEQILLNRKEVTALIGLSRSQIYALVKLGRFPEPLRLGDGPKGAVRWRKSEVLAWVDARPRTGTRADLKPYQA